jgi:hypothetical protein
MTSMEVGKLKLAWQLQRDFCLFVLPFFRCGFYLEIHFMA